MSSAVTDGKKISLDPDEIGREALAQEFPSKQWKDVDDPTTCPACSSGSVVPILYGLPTERVFRAADRGEIALGGCCVVEGADPAWKCLECGAVGGVVGRSASKA